jgi:hypothetical protein
VAVHVTQNARRSLLNGDLPNRTDKGKNAPAGAVRHTARKGKNVPAGEAGGVAWRVHSDQLKGKNVPAEVRTANGAAPKMLG